uniref:(northern house mosquito) hypothetical protein n=1 Tax=Culex pipiens TaxID=7175 RepID=A0A8D8A8F5_CULPI
MCCKISLYKQTFTGKASSAPNESAKNHPFRPVRRPRRLRRCCPWWRKHRRRVPNEGSLPHPPQALLVLVRKTRSVWVVWKNKVGSRKMEKRCWVEKQLI